MKKIFATVLAASMMLVGAQAFAQTAVNAGYLSSTATSKVGNAKTSGDMNGFYVGASRNIPVVAGLGVEPGINLEMLFASSKKGYFSGSTTEGYVQVPVMLNYGIELMPDCRLFAYAGPTLSLGLLSSSKATVGGGSAKVNNYDNSDYGRFDLMLGGGVGFDINNIRIKVGYNAGMLDRNSGSAVTMHRSEITLGAALLF